MEILKLFLTFLVGFGTILIGDAIWLGYIMKNFTIREFGNLVVVKDGSIDLKLWVGLLAWAVIVLLVLVFVTKSGYAQSIGTALFWGWVMWGLSYAMYDLTNLTFLKNYSLAFTLVDISWGVFLLAMVSLTMYLFSTWINKVL